jgi:two-component system cell cycle sensor histidine kinase/response regulator CckA
MPAKDLLKQKDLKFRLLFEDNPLPMWVFDRETLCFLEVNHAAVAHYGYTHEEFLRMTIADIRPPEDLARLKDSVARASGLALSGQWRHRLKDGRQIDVEVASHTISYGGRQAVLSVMQDITQRKQLEEQVRQSAKMEAVGMLAGGIAHDFNNLLTIINGYSHILLNAIPTSDPNHSAVEQIMKAGERAAGLTRQLLSYSRRQVLQPKLLNLNQLITGMEAMLRRLIGEDIELHFAAGSAIGQVSADPGQLEQVVMNLAVNARDAMPGGGILTIETGNIELDDRYTSMQATVKPGKYVALVVSDNGSGMDAETRAHLFEPFFTTKAQGQGTGLGMTTVFSIVKQSGGGMQVYSEPGKGTSVKVFLPCIDRPAAPETEAPLAKAVRGSETILLVEDEDQVRNLVRDTLRREGYKILDAPNAAEARRIAAAYKGPIHLLITDVVMPKEGGRELAASLAPPRSEMRVLFMSGYMNQAVVDTGLVTKAAFIQKPFTPAALSSKVREILGTNGETSHGAGG